MSNKNKGEKNEIEKDSKPDQITAYISRIGNIGNTLIALSALAYALGFIIVNTYLATKYGIYDFEILNARYVYSGAVFLLLCLLAYFGATFLSSMVELIPVKSFFLKIFGFIFLFGVEHGIYTLIFVSILVVALKRPPDAFFNLSAEIPIALWLDIAMIIFYIEIHLYKSKSWEKLPQNIPFPSSVFTTVILLALIYGVNFYFFMPPSVGGGLPTPITLIVDKSQIQAVENILPVTLQNPLVTVYLIEQSSDSYYVLVGNEFKSSFDSLLLPVQIHKSLIVGIAYPNKIETSKYLTLNNVTFPSTATPTLTPTATSTVAPRATSTP